MPAVVRGVLAAIKWQYYVAAKVHGYTLVRAEGKAEAWQVVATVVERDGYKLAQRPLVFAATHATGSWFWPIESYTLLENGRFEARLGPIIK